MRISHRNLEAIRRNPKMALQIQSGRGGSNSIARNWQFKLKPYHTAGFSIEQVANDFHSYCLGTFKNTRDNLSKINDLYDKYPSYVSNYKKQKLSFLSFHSKIKFTIDEDNILSGEIFRIDKTKNGGFSITLFWNNQESEIWATELRFPLLQKYYADKYGVTTDKVQVGIFNFENQSHEYITFDQESIEDALDELSGIMITLG
jgi:hypothetical protein